jgi:Fe-S-cluster containining protein
MLLLTEDVRRLENQGFKEDFFIFKFRGFKKLKNSNGRCVFHDGEQCIIYSNRPSGCRLYPIIFDEDLNRPVKDKFCPFRDEFSLPFKVRQESSKLYQKLIIERQSNSNKIKHLEGGS